MATKEEREDRKKRIDKTKDRDNLIINDKGKIVDIHDMLENSDNPIVIRIRRLREYGITDEMIKEQYSNITNNIEDKKGAVDVLKNVYINLVRAINRAPNGIIIDPKTGRKDEEKSAEKAERDGIEDNTYYANLIKEGKEFISQQIDRKSVV